MPPEDDDATQSVEWLLRGHWVALAIRAAVELDVFDSLEEPRPLDELAEATSADPTALARLLHALEDVGLLHGGSDGRYVLTAMGDALRTGHPAGLRELAYLQTQDAHVASWMRLADAVRANGGVFEAVNGVSNWDYINADAERAAHFNAAMARRGGAQAAAIRAGCDLRDVSTIVDVGGGKGGMLTVLLQAEPRLSAIVADLPGVAAEADAAFAAAGLADRARGVPANFFESVPTGGDAYIVSNVLHDWVDDDAVAILRTVRSALKPTARLWIIERVLDAPGRTFEQSREVHFLDLHMLVLFGARERTTAEYGYLLQAAGFDRGVLLDTGSQWNVIEARPA